ncbi:hypothetical protein K1719_043852 [Acacia pycnantha]|nr:hypothetical protein K1719_043852 [Acacia pycnantha]
MDQSNPMNSIGDSKTEHQDGQGTCQSKDGHGIIPSTSSFLMTSIAPIELLDVGVQALEKDMAHKQQVDETMRHRSKKFSSLLVRELKGHYNLDFIAIVETRCNKEMSLIRANQLGFPNMELVDCEGYSGGIWCLWNHNISAITVLERHHQFIHLQVTGAAVALGGLFVVYASPSCVSGVCYGTIFPV